MDSPFDILPWWQHLKKMVENNCVTPIETYYLQKLFEDAINEKNQIETEQIISRVMYKPCFTHKEEKEKISVAQKFRYLKKYYWEMGHDLDTFGFVVMSSIIREWPVKIEHTDSPHKYIWDRAPISIAMKGGNIRKDGDQYVIRVLALDESDIGSILYRAISSTQLVSIDENGQESLVKNASIIELNKEGGEVTRKREVEKGSYVNSTGKKSRSSRSLKNTEESQSPYFENGFENLAGKDGTLVFVPRKGGMELSNYIADDSKNIIFSIKHISIIDPNDRNTITQKYLLKTDFEFVFLHKRGAFAIRSAGFNPSAHCEYPIVLCKHPLSTVRSMPFEVSSNASTHWKKSFSAIWATLYDYYFKMGQLSELEKNSSKKENEGFLTWGRVKEMVCHFISSRSEIHVRPLSDSEMRTISRMILARRLEEYNEFFWKKRTGKREYNGEWVINDLLTAQKNEIQDLILGKRMKIPSEESLNGQTGERQTFTQLLNREMQSVKMKDEYLVKESDFIKDIKVLSGREPEEASCNIHSWLHSISEIIVGQTLHLNPKTTIRMFNNNLITLRSAESAKRTVKNILSLAKAGKRATDDGAKVLMIRIDERDEFRLLFEMIDPAAPEDPYHFGYYSAKAIKETKIPLNKQLLKPDQEATAMRDGVITKKKEICGLFAFLKTGYLSDFHKIIVSSEGKLNIYPIFKSENSPSSVYPYDFTPAVMVNNEINPLIGPKRNTNIRDPNVETYTEIESTITDLASLRLKDQQIRRAQKLQKMQQMQRPPMVEEYAFTAPLAPSQFQHQQSPQFAYQPIVNNYNVQHVNVYDGAPPPYSSQTELTYANQGVQAQPPFTPPDQSHQIDGLVGFNNPSFQPL